MTDTTTPNNDGSHRGGENRPNGTQEEDEDTCPICLETLTRRVSYRLTCNHTFCQPCIATMKEGWSDEPEKLRCPLCRGTLTRMKTPQPRRPLKLVAEIEVNCFGPEGIDAIKTALRTAKANSTPENQVEVRLKGTPRYIISIVQLPPLFIGKQVWIFFGRVWRILRLVFARFRGGVVGWWWSRGRWVVVSLGRRTRTVKKWNGNRGRKGWRGERREGRGSDCRGRIEQVSVSSTLHASPFPLSKPLQKKTPKKLWRVQYRICVSNFSFLFHISNFVRNPKRSL